MEKNLTPDERELIKLVHFFEKRASTLIAQDKPESDYHQILETCGKLSEQVHLHAQNRQLILDQREELKGMIKDHARCPKCSSNEMLKIIGTDKSTEGWTSNKYKCRRCNITFVWNTPNNPWDMIPYVEKFIKDTEEKFSGVDPADPVREANMQGLEAMKLSLDKLKPVVEAADLDLKDLEEREQQMADMVRKFKKILLIEKIKLEE